MLHALTAWFLKLIEELPAKIAWGLLIAILTTALTLHVLAVTRIARLEVSDARQEERFNAILGSLTEFTNELRLYRESVQEENRRLRALADDREGQRIARRNAREPLPSLP